MTSLVFFALLGIAVLFLFVIYAFYALYYKSQHYSAPTASVDKLPIATEILPITFEEEKYIRQGWVYHQAFDWSNAIAYYEKSLQFSPMNLPALMQLVILYFDQKDVEMAEVILQDMFDNPRHFGEEKLLWAIVRILSEHNHGMHAMPYMHRLLEIDPTNTQYKAQYQKMQGFVNE